MADSTDIMKRLRNLDADVTRLGHIAAVLEWDQETYMPEQAAEERAAQIALISGLHHEKVTSDDWGEVLAEAGDSGFQGINEIEAAFLREILKRREKKLRVPRRLVEDMARGTSLSQSAWIKARKSNDFVSFAPYLENMISLQKEYALCVAPDSDPYDTLLDEYEPGARGDSVAAVFDGLATGLKDLMGRIQGGSRPEGPFLDKSYDVNRQDEFGRTIQRYMGYDTRRGRLDISAHPFTTTLGPADVRVTTRYDADNILSGLFSNIHEAGHGLYEQGFGEELKGSLLADGTSLGIHESQSRFWENTLGRSRAFWKRWYPDFQKLFPENLHDVDVETFYKAANSVEPSFIRVDADEVTYGFHIIIRFRLERALLSGTLRVADLPSAWNEAYSEYLGIHPANDADGCMQDVHWSAGLFGYFPTYALGNLYAAQFTNTMVREIGSLDSLTSGEDASLILGWLRRNIHIHGRVLSPSDLCRRITGENLNPKYFLDYLEKKYADIYEF